MAQSSTGKISSVEQLDVIVDADAHVTESVEDFLPYIDEKYSGVKKMISSGGAITTSPTDTVFSYSLPAPFEATLYKSDERRTNTPEAKLEEMTDFGITHSIIGPTLMNVVHTINNPQYAMAFTNAYNSWLLDNILDKDDAFKGLIQVATHKPDIAAEEIDRLADEDDFVGVLISPTGLMEPMGDEKYHPIYQAAEDNGLPIVIHPHLLIHSFPIQEKYSHSLPESLFLSFPLHQFWHICTILYRGIPELFPDLDFVWQEAGMSQVPYLKWRLDNVYLEHPNQIPGLNRLPSEYISENHYFTTQPVGHTAEHPEHLAWAIEMGGTENIMYSSDLPHLDFDPPEELLERITKRFDNEQIRNIMGENANRVFDI